MNSRPRPCVVSHLFNILEDTTPGSMRIIPGFIAISLITVLYTSCQQEVDGYLPPGVVAQYQYLTQYTVLDTTWVAGRDTVINNHFTYDHKKRISRAFSTYYLPNSGLQSSPLYTHDFVYTYQNDTDSFPSKVTDTYRSIVNPADTWTETVFLWYGGGIVIKDSVIMYNGNFRTTSYEKLTESSFRLAHVKPIRMDTTYSRVEWKYGNLQWEVDSLFFVINNIPFYRTFERFLLFDAGYNPFNRILLPYKVPFNQRGLDFYFLFYDQAYPGINNPVFFTENSAARWSWNYTYNADKLPVISRMTDEKKAFYKYKTML